MDRKANETNVTSGLTKSKKRVKKSKINTLGITSIKFTKNPLQKILTSLIMSFVVLLEFELLYVVSVSFICFSKLIAIILECIFHIKLSDLILAVILIKADIMKNKIEAIP